MTKIKMLNDRIIFDGHADTRQECETITLMANLLNSCGSGFNTVEYRAGYAEFVKSDCIKLRNDELKFVPSKGNVTVVFDSHISKVENSYGSVTTSGSTLSTSDAINPETFIVTLEDGYIIDTVVLDNTDAEVYGSLGSISETSFTVYPGYGAIGGTITITSKIPAAKQTIDVATLSGWANLSTGNHQITVKTKASGYADSAASNAVTVNKAATPHSVSATSVSDMVAKTSYYFSVDNGETWTAITAAGQIVASTTQIKFKVTIGSIPIGATAQITSTQLGLNLKTYNSVAGGSGEAISSNYTLTQDITDIVCKSSEYDT